MEKKTLNKIKFFENQILKLSGKLKIRRPYIKQDNRLGGYIASICEGVHIKTGRKRHFLTYNAKIINQLSKWMIIHSILHEFGHIKTKARNEQTEEYKAEKFALKAIEKHFPKYYKRSINYIRNFVGSGMKIYDKPFAKLLKELE